MRAVIALIVVSAVLTTGCQRSRQAIDLPQDEFIQVYFNHRDSGDRLYQDPYRQIERSGDNLEAVIIREIDSAKVSIDLAIQEINLPGIAQALVRRHRQGIKVRVILDNNYSRALSSFKTSEIKNFKPRDRQKYHEFKTLVDLDGNGRLSSSEIAQRDALAILQQAQIPLLDDTADGTKGSGLMHHKFMVIDNQAVLMGSANFTLSGLLGDFDNLDTKGNVNHLLRIENPQVAGLFKEEFNYMWGKTPGKNSKFGLGKLWRSPVNLSWQNTQVTLQFAPISPTKPWQSSSNGLIAQTINNARNSLNLALFVFSDRQIAKAITQKQQQGIEVKGIFDRGFAWRNYSAVWDLLGIDSSNLCQSQFPQAVTESIGIANLPNGDKLHHKFALIDQETVISGSQNWSAAGNHSNDEVVIVIHNATVAKHFEQEFERLANSAIWDLPPRPSKCSQ